MCYIYKEDIGKERCIQMILDGHNEKSQSELTHCLPHH